MRITVTPKTLEVLQPNTIRVAATLPAGRDLAECRWILSGGADEIITGCAGVVQVPAVPADISWSLTVTEEQVEVLRQEGKIPLERLWVKGDPTGTMVAGSRLGTEDGATVAGSRLGTGGVEIEWSMKPGMLGVLQDTKVILDAAAPEGARCSWDVGAGEAVIEGCKASHLFKEAHRDRTVTLTVLRDDEALYSGARLLPLERLPVTPSAPQPEGDLADCGDGCRRLAIAAVEGGGLDRAYSLAATTGAAALVLFLHEPLPPASALEDLARYLGAQHIGLLPVACGDGLDQDALQELLTSHALRAGLVLHSDTSDLPARYSMQWGPAFLAALPTRADIPDEKWLSDQLETAAMFHTRILLSCRGFDRLTSESPPLLPSPYRQYEKMRRGGLKLFVSGGHRAFYPGTYGNLRTLSPGRAQGTSTALLGQDAPLGPTAALVDMDNQRIIRITGVAPAGDGWVPLPEEGLPEKAGVYRLWK